MLKILPWKFKVIAGVSVALALAFLFFTEGNHVARGGATNIDVNDRYSWNDLVGWIDFNENGGGNVEVVASSMKGWASSSAGVFSLNCQNTPASSPNICGISNYKVINDGSGKLSGWAWNDIFGWISFCGGAGTTDCPGSSNYQVTIDSNGDFNGAAWNDAIGPIYFNSAGSNPARGLQAYKVNTSWRNSPVYATATLDSAVIDTGRSEAQLNSIIFHGVLNGGSVGFQVATSVSATGPWTFTGPNGAADISVPANRWNVNAVNPTDAVKVGYSVKDFRYIRYRIYLESNGGATASPRIDGVILNWSP